MNVFWDLSLAKHSNVSKYRSAFFEINSNKQETFRSIDFSVMRRTRLFLIVFFIFDSAHGAEIKSCLSWKIVPFKRDSKVLGPPNADYYGLLLKSNSLNFTEYGVRIGVLREFFEFSSIFIDGLKQRIPLYFYRQNRGGKTTFRGDRRRVGLNVS